MPITGSRTVLFGPYTLDLHSGELRKLGARIRMGEQSFRILCLLLDSPGELVTRDQLRASLWASDTFVDFDHGLNSAVQRLRDCLSDTAEKPRWIETVPRRGYRFVGQVQWQEHEACPEAAPEPLAQTTIGPVGGEASSEFSGQNAPVRPIAPAWRRRVSMIATLALFFLAAGLLAWNTGGVRDRLFPSERASRIHSIAVLPLANLSGDSSQDYFADGMTDELITALAQNHSLRIASRTSAMQFKGVQRPVREIARELGVDGVLEGSVSRTANRVHMTVQLIYAPTDSHVWADSYDRDLNQAVSLPEELSQTVAKEVKSATSADVPRRHINPEAHDAYLRGRYFWFRGSIPETLSFFEKAIQLQPDYAAAWAGLSDTYALRGVFRGGPPKEDLAKAGETARRAVELDDSLAEAHLSMAAWYMWSWNPLQGDAEARKAIDLNPTYAESHYFRHLILLALNRSQEALQEAKRAVELDPFARTYGLGQCYIDLRRFDTAIDELHMQAQLHPADAYLHRVLAEAYWHEGEYSKSQEELEKGLKVSGRSKDAAAVHRAFERGGAKAVAQWQAEIMKTRASKEYVSRFEIASAVALTGDKDETLKHLEASYREHEPALILIETEPAFDFLHSDPRYRTLVRTIGLTPSD